MVILQIIFLELCDVNQIIAVNLRYKTATNRYSFSLQLILYY